MNIIEKEIAKRQNIIDSRDEKLAAIKEHKNAVTKLEEEVASINTEVLEAEIAELKSFLSTVDESVVPEVNEEG